VHEAERGLCQRAQENEIVVDNISAHKKCVHARWTRTTARAGRRQEAGARALQRAHAQKLLRTLISICRRLCRSQPDPVAFRAYREEEKDLREMTKPTQPVARRRGAGTKKS